jgi:hypothetical protein
MAKRTKEISLHEIEPHSTARSSISDAFAHAENRREKMAFTQDLVLRALGKIPY